MNKKELFKKLRAELRKKKIPLSEIEKAEAEIKEYLDKLQRHSILDLTTDLKEFVRARR